MSRKWSPDRSWSRRLQTATYGEEDVVRHPSGGGCTGVSGSGGTLTAGDEEVDVVEGGSEACAAANGDGLNSVHVTAVLVVVEGQLRNREGASAKILVAVAFIYHFKKST